MNLKVQRRIASELLKCGSDRVWFNPDSLDQASKAITREDIRGLIKKGIIKKKQAIGVSRGRARIIAEKKRKGRRTGAGRRRGTKNARFPKKKRWMIKIRSQRKVLKGLRDTEEITRKLYRKFYLMAKGGIFRSKNHMSNFILKFKEREEQ
ncbi:MAG: 50S ribosomal protein L19e [Candidatus Altiarchaeota archaeon]|nr:50S ribosomal protein L19e [Candidatus Altiarchaeota archaeon]